MFGRMTVTPVVHVGANADLQVAITTLLRAADQPEIVRWIDFPRLVLLFLLVPGDSESGRPMSWIARREPGIWSISKTTNSVATALASSINS